MMNLRYSVLGLVLGPKGKKSRSAGLKVSAATPATSPHIIDIQYIVDAIIYCYHVNTVMLQSYGRA